jgi:hypothetical protein
MRGTIWSVHGPTAIKRKSNYGMDRLSETTVSYPAEMTNSAPIRTIPPIFLATLSLANFSPRFCNPIITNNLYALLDAIQLKHVPIYGRSDSGMEGHEAKGDVGPTRASEPVLETTVEELKQERVLIWKIDMHILPFVVLLYLFSFLDRGKCSERHN